MHTPYQHLYVAPFGLLGLRCNQTHVCGIDFLAEPKSVAPCDSPLLQQLISQLDAYFQLPQTSFQLPLSYSASDHQQKVWAAISNIPCGQVRQYGELAQQLGSSAQAVGQACGANPFPIIIPCHRVVARHGAGGFARQRNGDLLDIKHWLLQHEQQVQLTD